jgi:hypothetical protein
MLHGSFVFRFIINSSRSHFVLVIRFHINIIHIKPKTCEHMRVDIFMLCSVVCFLWCDRGCWRLISNISDTTRTITLIGYTLMIHLKTEQTNKTNICSAAYPLSSNKPTLIFTHFCTKTIVSLLHFLIQVPSKVIQPSSTIT